MRYLVTGAAGFIGFHVALKLLKRGDTVVGLDNVNSYYDPTLKEARLKQLEEFTHFRFMRAGLEDRQAVEHVFANHIFDRVIHLAAQAGVRYSLENPYAYADSNLTGFVTILESCRNHKIPHLVFASSSSVYGGNTHMPFSVKDSVNHPVSLYAATKRANELMAHTYAHLFNLPCTGLRFFTVYGPWGRPDMAYFSFTQAISEGKPINVFNHGKMQRDFTYIDDIVDGVIAIAEVIPQKNPQWNSESPDPSSSSAPYKLFNIGNHQPVELLEFISILESELGMKAKKNFLPMQPGDVPATYADIDDLEAAVGFRPKTPLKEGLHQFIDWYKNYYMKATV